MSFVSSEPLAARVRCLKATSLQTSAGVIVLEMYFAMRFSSPGAGAYL